jgi:hypothetical protein
MVSASQFVRGKFPRWIAPIGILLMVVMIGAAVHVHPNDLTGATCVVCVGGRTSAPATVVTVQILLVAMASVPILRELHTPTCEPVLFLFIRPPPMA